MRGINIMESNYFESKEFNEKYNYDGELGVIYSKNSSEFKLWAPLSEEVQLILYGKEYNNLDANKTIIKMNKEDRGVWRVIIDEDLNGEYYNYLVRNNGKTYESVDPYAKAVSINGEKSMVIDMEITNPTGWSNDKRPLLKAATDSIIYEAHIRDLTKDEASGVIAVRSCKRPPICYNETITEKTGGSGDAEGSCGEKHTCIRERR